MYLMENGGFAPFAAAPRTVYHFRATRRAKPMPVLSLDHVQLAMPAGGLRNQGGIGLPPATATSVIAPAAMQ
jgi:hypothetical protein